MELTFKLISYYKAALVRLHTLNQAISWGLWGMAGKVLTYRSPCDTKSKSTMCLGSLPASFVSVSFARLEWESTWPLQKGTTYLTYLEWKLKVFHMYYHILTCSFFFISRKSRSRLCYICYFDPPTRLYVIPTVRRFVFVWIGSEWRGADAGVGSKTRGRRILLDKAAVPFLSKFKRKGHCRTVENRSEARAARRAASIYKKGSEKRLSILI